MNIGTRIRTVLVIASCFNTALMATDVAQFHNPKLDLIYKILSVIANFVIVFCATYFNNDYTETACEYTGLMRQAKDEDDPEYEGEVFFSNVAEDEVGEDEE